MRAIFGVLSLLIVVAVVGVLAKKQLSSVPAPPVAAPGVEGKPAITGGTPKEQVQQFKQAVDGAVQAPRPMPDETR